jgi:hypothetical protein
MRYYFDVASPHGLACDNEGEEFPSEAKAIDEAVFSARELASERVLRGEPLADWAVIMRDEEKRFFQTLRLKDVVLGSQ